MGQIEQLAQSSMNHVMGHVSKYVEEMMKDEKMTNQIISMVEQQVGPGSRVQSPPEHAFKVTCWHL